MLYISHNLSVCRERERDGERRREREKENVYSGKGRTISML